MTERVSSLLSSASLSVCPLFPFSFLLLILYLKPVKSKNGYVLVDGHHHVLAGIALGLKS